MKSPGKILENIRKDRNMKKFDFGSTVEICGKEYRIDVSSPGVPERLKEQKEKMNRAFEKFKEDRTALSDILNTSREFVDTLLGKGAFDEIFAGRTIIPMDLSSLFIFLTDAINEQRSPVSMVSSKS